MKTKEQLEQYLAEDVEVDLKLHVLSGDEAAYIAALARKELLEWILND